MDDDKHKNTSLKIVTFIYTEKNNKQNMYLIAKQ